MLTLGIVQTSLTSALAQPHLSSLKPKEILAAAALIVASVLAVWGMLLPPVGDVEQNLLILVAQFLVFAATLLGIGSTFERLLKRLQEKEGQS